MSRSNKYTKKSKNHKRNNKTKMRLKKGGNCGCAGKGTGLFLGGDSSAGTFRNTLLDLPSTNYYPLNKYDNDPNYGVIASRQTGNFVVGGGKRHRKTRRGVSQTHKRNKRRGGNLIGAGPGTLQSMVSNAVVGSNDYAPNNSQFFSTPYSMYSSVNPPPSA
jgi:hypothetical protein